jgi:uncharacterized protein
MPSQLTLAEVLASVSDALFPAELGEHPVAIDSRGVDGDTPLHVLMWRHDAEGVAVLIAAGADVNAIGDMSETPLHVALRNEDRPIVDMLIRAGARTDLRSEFGFTATEKAADMGIAEWLNISEAHHRTV